MKKVIFDSSSSILLYKCGIFKQVLDFCIPVISSSVKSEITSAGHEGAAFFSSLCYDNKIRVVVPKHCNVQDSASLHTGERDSVVLFYNGEGDYVVLDDRKGALFCRKNDIPYVNALLLAKILFINGVVDLLYYQKCREWLTINGRYSKEIINYIENAGEMELHGFFI